MENFKKYLGAHNSECVRKEIMVMKKGQIYFHGKIDAKCKGIHLHESGLDLHLCLKLMKLIKWYMILRLFM